MRIYKNRIIVLLMLMIAVMYTFIKQSDHFLSDELNVYEKIAGGAPFNYLIIGDSIGRGAGAENIELRWFNQLEVLLEDSFGSKGRRYSVVQSGATAFEGIYKLQQFPHEQSIDLIFIVFGENDRKFMDPHEFAFFYEKLIRDAKERHQNAEIITIVESSLKQEVYADTIKRVSAHYRAKCLDMRIPFAESGMLTENLTTDMVHPNGNGYRLYAQTIFDLMEQNIKNDAEIATYPKPLKESDLFFLADNKQVIYRKGFNYKNGLYVTTNPGDYMEYEFEGPTLGVKVIRSQVGGMMNVYIDGEYVRTMSTWWPFSRERYLYIASGLENKKHIVRFEAEEDVSVKNPSTLRMLQISSIIVAETKEP
jgi:lysophospholipase L1-like esterase